MTTYCSHRGGWPSAGPPQNRGGYIWVQARYCRACGTRRIDTICSHCGRTLEQAYYPSDPKDDTLLHRVVLVPRGTAPCH